MGYHLAVDVGGSIIRAASFEFPNQEPHARIRIPTQVTGISPLERICEAITTVWPASGTIHGIAVAVPGPVDPHAGMILKAPNIPGWHHLSLQSELEDRFKVPVLLGNDANLAALGEWKYGAGVGHHHLIYLTISTGIGSGIIVGDELLLGAQGLAAELGHVTVLPDGPYCGCGKQGHLEAVASGPAIARYVELKLLEGYQSILPTGSQLSARDIALAAQSGDALAREAFELAGNYIGTALADFLHIFNPTMVIIGGGVSNSGPLLFDPIRRTLQGRVISSHYLTNLSLTTAALGDDAGLMGALVLAQNNFPPPSTNHP